MDISAVGEVAGVAGAVASAAKSLGEAISALRSKVKGNREVDEITSVALERVLAVQSSALQFQEMAFRLSGDAAQLKYKLLQAQRENDDLRRQIREEEERAAERKNYRLVNKEGAVVLVRDGDTKSTYYCPACFQIVGRAIPIQLHPLGWEIPGRIAAPTAKRTSGHWSRCRRASL